jgi:hypothetical protein
LRPDELDGRYGADLLAVEANDGPRLQALDVSERGLQRVALPPEAALAADGKDEQHDERQGHDAEDADFQF